MAEEALPKEEARYYGEAFERGGVLITVSCKTDNIERCARQMMISTEWHDSAQGDLAHFRKARDLLAERVRRILRESAA